MDEKLLVKPKALMVSAGHSATDPGAVSGKWVEAKLALELRDLVVDILRREGHHVISDGDKGVNLPLRTAANMAKAADIAIELHFNAGPPSAKGVEVLAAQKDKRLAQDIAVAIASVTGSPLRGERGFKPEGAGQHKRLAFVQAGGLVVEVEFISNPDAMSVYESKKHQVASAIAGVLMVAAVS